MVVDWRGVWCGVVQVGVVGVDELLECPEGKISPPAAFGESTIP